jgi:hypothetical protein
VLFVCLDLVYEVVSYEAAMVLEIPSDSTIEARFSLACFFSPICAVCLFNRGEECNDSVGLIM